MKTILGIDVGGTKIAAGLVDSKFRVTKFRTWPTSQTNLPQQLVEIAKSYRDFEGIGLGVPGDVSASGWVEKFDNIKRFKPMNLKQLLVKNFHLPVHVMNDARAFTLAEATLGAGKSHKKVVGVIMGTGIGGGIVINQQIYNGPKYLRGGHWRNILMKPNITIEQAIQRFGSFKKARQSVPFLKILIPYITRAVQPDAIIFGGGRMKFATMDKLLASVRSVGSRVVLKRFRLPHPGILGAALPLLRR